MDQRVKTLRGLEPKKSGRASYTAILEAAAGLFGQFPAKDITLSDVLSISGVSNQTLYNYFPNGRDDIALALYDRYQLTMVVDFNNHIRSFVPAPPPNDSEIIDQISACLARATFGFLRESREIQSTLVEYLQDHNLLMVATHMEELDAALAEALALHLGEHLSTGALPRIVRLAVGVVREIGLSALRHRTFDIDELESNARRMVRTLLSTGLKEQDRPSGFHVFHPHPPAPMAVLGVPISPAKKQSIRDRILKRKRRD